MSIKGLREPLRPRERSMVGVSSPRPHTSFGVGVGGRKVGVGWQVAWGGPGAAPTSLGDCRPVTSLGHAPSFTIPGLFLACSLVLDQSFGPSLILRSQLDPWFPA